MSKKKNNISCETCTSKRKLSPIEIFVAMMAASTVFYIVFYMIKGHAEFVDPFFLRTEDLFMDFFNSVKDASQGPEVYTVRHVIYPPMANFIYLIFSRFIPSEYYNTYAWINKKSWMEFESAIFFIALLTMLFAFVLYILVHHVTEGSSISKVLFAFFAVFNIPVLYMLERGNMILFSFIALIIYAFTYNSQNKVYREIGLISLAFAFSIKLYPVVFGWFLLTDKRYKEAIRCAIYGVLMLIIPSFFFGGPACFVQIFKNITSFSSGTSTVNSISVIAGYTRTPYAVWNTLSYIWVFICALCFILSPFIHSERWKGWVLGLSTIFVVPSLTTLYAWAFLLIPIIMMSNSKKFTSKNKFFFYVMASLFLFTVMRFNYRLTWNQFLMYPLTAVLSVTAVVDTVICGVKKYKLYAASKKAVN